MDSKNYAEVLIDGKIYTLGGIEEEAYLQKVASYINEKSSVLRKQSGFSKQSTEYQMVMTELNIADDYFKEKNLTVELEFQKNAMEKESYSLKHELVTTQIKLEGVLRELDQTQRRLEEMKGNVTDPKVLQEENRNLKEEIEKLKALQAVKASNPNYSGKNHNYNSKANSEHVNLQSHK